MSVNIFGSSGSATWKGDNRYVDRKFITLTTNLASKVNKSGDTLTGPLLMGEHKITSNHVPVADDDVANKKYVDTIKTEIDTSVASSNLNSKLDKTGGILTGSLDIGPNKIMSSYTPRDAIDLTNKAYVDAALAHRLVGNEIE